MEAGEAWECLQPLGAGRGGDRSLRKDQEAAWPCQCLCFSPLFLTANSPELWEDRLLPFSATRSWFLLQQPLETDTVGFPQTDSETQLWVQTSGKWEQAWLQRGGKQWEEGRADKGFIKKWLCWGPSGRLARDPLRSWPCGSCFKIFLLCRKIPGVFIPSVYSFLVEGHSWEYFGIVSRPPIWAIVF